MTDLKIFLLVAGCIAFTMLVLFVYLMAITARFKRGEEFRPPTENHDDE